MSMVKNRRNHRSSRGDFIVLGTFLVTMAMLQVLVSNSLMKMDQPIADSDSDSVYVKKGTSNFDSTRTTAGTSTTTLQGAHSHSSSNSYTSNPNRLCTQNQYANVLKLPLSDTAGLMDQWLANKALHEKALMEHKDTTLAHTHARFDAFEVMGDCAFDCVGGECRRDESKIACGVTAVEAPCVVYSIGGNNKWAFEKDLLQKTPCEIHTFDCTGLRERFDKPDNDRLHFHHVCLGTANAPAPKTPPTSHNDIGGEFWTLEKMQKTLNHTQIDLFKMDIEGYEFPLFNSWPILTDIKSPSTVLPMQVLVEVHYRTQMTELATDKRVDWKFPTDLINLQEHFLKMGYAVVIRDDNKACKHCTELTLVRIKCPSSEDIKLGTTRSDNLLA